MKEREALEAAWRVVAAVELAGPHPEYHATVVARHRQEWPTLWQAIDELIGAVKS